MDIRKRTFTYAAHNKSATNNKLIQLLAHNRRSLTALENAVAIHGGPDCERSFFRLPAVACNQFLPGAFACARVKAAWFGGENDFRLASPPVETSLPSEDCTSSFQGGWARDWINKSALRAFRGDTRRPLRDVSLCLRIMQTQPVASRCSRARRLTRAGGLSQFRGRAALWSGCKRECPF